MPSRREFYKSVVALLNHFGGPKALLDAAAEAMTEKSPGRLAAIWATLQQDDALGQIYQAINAPTLEAAYRATARSGRKFTAGEIPSVTQLFTPKWVVEFLLQNTLGRLWWEIHPDTHLKDHWPYLVQTELSRQPPRAADTIKVCDPACGTMNFGLVALDMLRKIYHEEIARFGSPGWPEKSCDLSQIDRSILQNNLFGFDIDPVALDLARRGLQIKTGQKIPEANLLLTDALFGQDLPAQFDIVVTNPPYLSARNLNPMTVAKLKRKFPTAWRDFYACFILRSLDLLRPGGRCGILCMHSFMFTGAFEKFRLELSRKSRVQTSAHFGPGLFDIGNPATLQTVAVVLQNSQALQKSTFFRLVDALDKQHSLLESIVAPNSRRFEIPADELSSMPRAAWMYWVCPAARRAFTTFPKLGQIAPPRQGLATTDNFRFVRYCWEVEPPAFSGSRDKWLPYAKGGRFRRWFESARHRVNWQNNGEEIKAAIVQRYPYLNGQWQWVAKNSAWYGKPGITYSYLTSGAFSARQLEPDAIFDVAGSSLFPRDPLPILGILNSSSARALLDAINPTVNFQVGDLAQVPLPPNIPRELNSAVAKAVKLTRTLETFDETSPIFVQPPPWNDGNLADIHRELFEIEQSIDSVVADSYGLQRRRADGPNAAAAQSPEIARQWISFALGIWLGRWGDTCMGQIAILCPLDPRFARDLRQILADRAGSPAASQIESSVGSLERFLARDFLPWHNRLYRGRPVFWGFGGNGQTVAVSSLVADRSLVRTALRAVGRKLPSNWKKDEDSTIRSLSALIEALADRNLQLNIRKLMDGRPNRESRRESAPPRRRSRRRAVPCPDDP